MSVTILGIGYSWEEGGKRVSKHLKNIPICHHKQAPWISPCGCHVCERCDTPVHMGEELCDGCEEETKEDEPA